MEKRIFRAMSLLMLLTTLFVALLWGVTASLRLPDDSRERLRTVRVTLLDSEGTVLFDSSADPRGLENHLDRDEVQQALAEGYGESRRFSQTLQADSYYYAKVMEDGRILRLAFTADTLRAQLLRQLPLALAGLALSLGFAALLAKRLTRSIVDPINGLDLFGPPPEGYHELIPLYRRIEAQRRELSRQLAEMEGRSATISAITENMREGLLLLDPRGRVALANGSVLRLFGQTGAAGKSVLQLCRDPAFTAEVKRCLAGEKAECTLQLKERTYQVLLNPVFREKEQSGGVVFFIDVTERHIAERQRKEFSANVSHELKTPLTTISALSEMMSEGQVRQEDMQRFAGRIKQQSDRLVNIVEDIIRLSAFDEGRAEGEMERVDVGELCRGVLDSLKDKAGERGVSLRPMGEEALILWGNRRMLDEMIFNLVDNAVKYNREGGSVTLSWERSGDECLIRVRDTGIGIPKQHQEHIFERFYRADKSRSKKTGGTGLGLSIVKHVAEYHGGRVEVESTEGEGSLFTCRLPLSQQPGTA